MFTTTFQANGISYKREAFVSVPDQAIVIRLTASKPGSLNFTANFKGELQKSSKALDNKTIEMTGLSGNHEGVTGQVKFDARARIINTGGSTSFEAENVRVSKADEVVILISIATNFTDYKTLSANETERCVNYLAKAEKRPYASMVNDHIAAYQKYFNRVSFDLGTTPAAKNPTDERIRNFSKNDDPELVSMYYQFGRYLLICCSQPGGQAANLQGIWNGSASPMWDSKYTININLQMNYWMAEVCNLSELHMPLMDLLKKMHARGRETARDMYGMRGMVCHHNTDYSGDCAPQDWYLAAMPWVTGGAWLALHAWEHYLHARDEDFLRDMYPILRDMALFYEDFLMEVEGQLVTCPSVSPENRYLLPDGYDTPVCAAPVMDQQILREFFGLCIQAARILETDASLAQAWEDIIARLPKDKTGSKGQLLEWQEEYPELTPGMGHMSHLFACFPGRSINWRDTPELMRAVRKSLEIRMENGAGRKHWPLAWFINLFARLMDRGQTDLGIRRMLADSTSRSLLNATDVFQIDGNLGAAAGIAECLLQSHLGLHFLPALPLSWPAGKAYGLCARGGHEVDLVWKNGLLAEAAVRTKFDGPVEVIGEELAVFKGDQPVITEKTPIGFTFDAKKGGAYRLVHRDSRVALD